LDAKNADQPIVLVDFEKLPQQLKPAKAYPAPIHQAQRSPRVIIPFTWNDFEPDYRQ
jgi:hypothetical protein